MLHHLFLERLQLFNDIGTFFLDPAGFVLDCRIHVFYQIVGVKRAGVPPGVIRDNGAITVKILVIALQTYKILIDKTYRNTVPVYIKNVIFFKRGLVMKKSSLMVSSVTFVLLMTGLATAKDLKPPKELCLALDVNPDAVFCLGIKPSVKIRFAEKKKVQYYTVQGSFKIFGTHYPIDGTGYMEDDLFLFHLNGLFSSIPLNQSIEGNVDLTQEPVAGSVNAIITQADTAPMLTTESIEEVPCSTVDKPMPLVSLETGFAAPSESPYSQ